MLGDHNLFRKTFAYEGSARIPFMVNAPDWLVNESGTASANVVGLQDVMPTLLDAAGAEIPDTVDGASLMPLMRGEDAAWRDYLHGEHLGTYRPEDAMQYLTDGKEKYIWYTVTGEEQLFNLVDDPQECHNLAPDPNHQDRLHALAPAHDPGAIEPHRRLHRRKRPHPRPPSKCLPAG